MSRKITIRFDADLAEWLAATARRRGVSQGDVVRDQLESARASAVGNGFMRLAGIIRGPKDLSRRKGLSRS